MGVPLSLTTRYSLRKNNRTLNYVNLRLQAIITRVRSLVNRFLLGERSVVACPPTHWKNRLKHEGEFMVMAPHGRLLRPKQKHNP